ncbi:MAG: hypothetical protein RI993_1687 [Pseudomonadota bacterium]|jgi:hypothetical protein
MQPVKAAVLLGIVSCLIFSVAQGHTHAGQWEKISIPDAVMTVVDENGDYRDIRPGCAFSHLPDTAGLPNQPFHFYYRKGKERGNTLIYFNGGGACWNDATCMTSLALGERPVYNPAIDHPENIPGSVGGILKQYKKDNPVRDWNMVFIPYCTGDAHIGSKDTVYRDPLGLINGGNPLIVQHRGFDNFMAVREWIKHNTNRKKTEHVLVAGSSAGDYGALLNFPRLRDLYSKHTQVTLLVDAGMGVFTQPFVDQIFNQADGGRWGAQDNLATWIPGFDQAGTYDATTLYQQIMAGVAGFFPKTRIGQYTAAWDGVQVLFLNVMLQTDAGSVNPLDWANIPLQTWLSWHTRMRNTLEVTARKKNVGFYLGAGTDHAALIDVFRPNYFFDEHSAQGVFLTDWVKRLLKDDKKLRNLRCDGDCGAPF